MILSVFVISLRGGGFTKSVFPKNENPEESGSAPSECGRGSWATAAVGGGAQVVNPPSLPRSALCAGKTNSE